MKNSFTQILGVFVTILSLLVLVLQKTVIANDEIDYTPGCLCPSKDKFPPIPTRGVTFATWCGYELGPKCNIQQGYKCEIEMANKEATFQTPNCLGIPKYCIPYPKIPDRIKTCGRQWQCEQIPSCKKSLNATMIALAKQRKTYGQNATKFRMPPVSY
jgi:hypothetical protein